MRVVRAIHSASSYPRVNASLCPPNWLQLSVLLGVGAVHNYLGLGNPVQAAAHIQANRDDALTDALSLNTPVPDLTFASSTVHWLAH